MPIQILHDAPATPTLDSLTRLRAEELSKKNAFEEGERLEAMGQENEGKGIKWVTEEQKELSRKDEEARNILYERLKRVSRRALKYNMILTEALIEYIRDEALPKKYRIKVEWNRQGVVLRIDGKGYIKAVRSSYIPRYDVFAMKMLATVLGNTVSRLEGNVRQTSSGILTPTMEETRIVLEGHGYH